MKSNLKPLFVLASLLLCSIGIIFIAGCSTFGTNPGPPTGVEKFIFTTQTNYVPVVQTVTNVQVVTKYETNTIPITNAVGVLAFQTNVFTVNLTNLVVAQQTNQVPAYTETLKPGLTQTLTAGGSILNTFFPGVGAVAVQGVLALLGSLAYMRSSKLGNTSTALAQEIEAIRNVVRAMPNGAAYDAALVNFMTAHQGEAGVLQQVATILENDVKNTDAQTAASQVQQFIAQLQLSTNPTGTPVPPAAPKV